MVGSFEPHTGPNNGAKLELNWTVQGDFTLVTSDLIYLMLLLMYMCCNLHDDIRSQGIVHLPEVRCSNVI